MLGSYILERMRTLEAFEGYGLYEGEELRNFKTIIRDASFVEITFTLTFNAEDFRQNYVAADVESKSNIHRDRGAILIKLADRLFCNMHQAERPEKNHKNQRAR